MIPFGCLDSPVRCYSSFARNARTKESSVQISFTKSPVAGLYRSRCCRHTLPMVASKILPLCPRCREVADWELVVPRAPRAEPLAVDASSDAA
jgi:hypothetical protein